MVVRFGNIFTVATHDDERRSKVVGVLLSMLMDWWNRCTIPVEPQLVAELLVNLYYDSHRLRRTLQCIYLGSLKHKVEDFGT